MDNQNSQNSNSETPQVNQQLQINNVQSHNPIDPIQQYPMSTSQMGLNENKSKFKLGQLIKPAIAILLILIVVVGGVVFYKGMSGYGAKTVQANDVNYSVTFSKNSSTQTINGKTYLQGKDKQGQTMLLAVGKSIQSTFDCHTSAGSSISIIDTPTIDGHQHNLCYSQSLNAYDMNFTHNDVWYFLTIFPKDKSQTIDQGTVKMIASSVKINS